MIQIIYNVPLLINNPHKSSKYLAVNSESMNKFVQENHLRPIMLMRQAFEITVCAL